MNINKVFLWLAYKVDKIRIENDKIK